MQALPATDGRRGRRANRIQEQNGHEPAGCLSSSAEFWALSRDSRRSALNRKKTANDLRVGQLLLPVSLCSKGKHEGGDLTEEKKHPLGENPFQFAKCHFWITDI